MDPLAAGLAVAVALVLGGVIGSMTRGSQERARREREVAAAQDQASLILERSRDEAEGLRRTAQLQGKEEAYRLRETWEQEETRRREDLERQERQAAERLESQERRAARLDERETTLDTRGQQLATRSDALDDRTQALDSAEAEARGKLESLAGLTQPEARSLLLEQLEAEARAEAANTLREIREEAQRTADREARTIVAQAIQRIAADQTAEMTVSVVQLPSDEMKGRIIGREGRNIRAFEQATGIDVIIDDTPEAVILSGFDPIRREVARIALERLIEDGRIHPGRIEEMVDRCAQDVEEGMVQAAEEVLYELGLHGIHAEIVRALGRLKYRTSYGQNQLQHSREVALLAGAMAQDMGLDVQIAKRAGLLHDVGKGLTHEQEGTHVELGHRLARKHGEPPQVLNAIRAHHDEEPHHFAETFLVTAADAISGSRPGARREMFDTYVKRLESLEEIAMEHPGVERVFAIQAGRELRIMVQPDRVSDADMAQISEQVARRIESELQYPGQIKIVVVRETRAVDFAR